MRERPLGLTIHGYVHHGEVSLILYFFSGCFGRFTEVYEMLDVSSQMNLIVQ
jgi:hypothetical protein